MFRTNTATAKAGEIEQGDLGRDHLDLVPLSHLSLDLPEPLNGWLAELQRRDIAVVTDDLGRLSISRGDARRLFDEQREAEARQAAKREAAEKAAVEADERRRASIWQGMPAELMPPDAHPAAVMLQSARDSQPKRLTPLQEALSNSGTLTYHSLSPTSEDES
jgi:hypothetical protein